MGARAAECIGETLSAKGAGSRRGVQIGIWSCSASAFCLSSSELCGRTIVNCSDTIEVRRGGKARKIFTFANVTLTVRSEPTGAEISVNRAPGEKTPLHLEFSARAHELTAAGRASDDWQVASSSAARLRASRNVACNSPASRQNNASHRPMTSSSATAR